MAKSTISSTGCRIAQEAGGYYTLTLWSRLSEGRIVEEHPFEQLTWTELVDVMLTWQDDHRPGYQLGDGWRQLPLFP